MMTAFLTTRFRKRTKRATEKKRSNCLTKKNILLLRSSFWKEKEEISSGVPFIEIHCWSKQDFDIYGNPEIRTTLEVLTTHPEWQEFSRPFGGLVEPGNPGKSEENKSKRPVEVHLIRSNFSQWWAFILPHQRSSVFRREREKGSVSF